jgi:DNA-binding transcriptional regulator YdaS (Cro superfamily)
MSATTAKLLQAAAEVLGSNAALARRLGVEEWLLCSYLNDLRELPDALLLRAVDIVLADRLANPSNLRHVSGVTENSASANSATASPGGAA